MTFKSIVLLTLLSLPLQAAAQDLYEAPADPNSSFVRVVAPGETLAVINGTTFDSFQGGVTPFLLVAPGPISVAVGSREAKGQIAPASFYTFAPGPDGTLQMLQDAITNSPAKADLVFYNESDLPLVDLYVPSVSAMAIKDIAPGTSREVSLKAPLVLDFEVQSKGAVLAKLPAVQMERRAGVTVVFSGSAGTYTAYSTQNTYAK
jgi:hypothetical protein